MFNLLKGDFRTMCKRMMFCLFCFCSLISISTSAYTIASYGLNYTLTLMPSQRAENVTGYLYLYTSEPKDVLVSMTLSSYMTWTSRKMNFTIPARSMINITLAPMKGIMENNTLMFIMYFGFESTSMFGLSVVLQAQTGYMSGYVALPNDYWSKAYTFPFYRSIMYETIIMIYMLDKVNTDCKGQTTSNGKLNSQFFTAIASRGCYQDKDAFEVTVNRYQAETGSKEFGLLANNLGSNFMSAMTTCGHEDESAFTSEMPIPDVALGTEFITLNSKEARGQIVIAALVRNTTVTEHLQKSTKQHDLKLAQDFVVLEASPGPRKITSSDSVQVAFVMFGTCGQDQVAKGDMSITMVIPTSLMYNNYFIGIPLLPSLEHFVMIISPEEVMNHLILNYNFLNVTWTPVIGAEKWHFGEKSLTEWSNRLISEKAFACYVYGIGKNMGYIYPAGYSSMGIMAGEFKEILSSWSAWSCSTNCSEKRKQRKRACIYTHPAKYDHLCREEIFLTQWKPGNCGNCTNKIEERKQEKKVFNKVPIIVAVIILVLVLLLSFGLTRYTCSPVRPRKGKADKSE